MVSLEQYKSQLQQVEKNLPSGQRYLRTTTIQQRRGVEDVKKQIQQGYQDISQYEAQQKQFEAQQKQFEAQQQAQQKYNTAVNVYLGIEEPPAGFDETSPIARQAKQEAEGIENANIMRTVPQKPTYETFGTGLNYSPNVQPERMSYNVSPSQLQSRVPDYNPAKVEETILYTPIPKLQRPSEVSLPPTFLQKAKQFGFIDTSVEAVRKITERLGNYPIKENDIRYVRDTRPDIAKTIIYGGALATPVAPYILITHGVESIFSPQGKVQRNILQEKIKEKTGGIINQKGLTFLSYVPSVSEVGLGYVSGVFSNARVISPQKLSLSERASQGAAQVEKASLKNYLERQKMLEGLDKGVLGKYAEQPSVKTIQKPSQFNYLGTGKGRVEEGLLSFKNDVGLSVQKEIPKNVEITSIGKYKQPFESKLPSELNLLYPSENKFGTESLLDIAKRKKVQLPKLPKGYEDVGVYKANTETIALSKEAGNVRKDIGFQYTLGSGNRPIDLSAYTLKGSTKSGLFRTIVTKAKGARVSSVKVPIEGENPLVIEKYPFGVKSESYITKVGKGEIVDIGGVKFRKSSYEIKNEIIPKSKVRSVEEFKQPLSNKNPTRKEFAKARNVETGSVLDLIVPKKVSAQMDFLGIGAKAGKKEFTLVVGKGGAKVEFVQYAFGGEVPKAESEAISKLVIRYGGKGKSSPQFLEQLYANVPQVIPQVQRKVLIKAPRTIKAKAPEVSVEPSPRYAGTSTLAALGITLNRNYPNENYGKFSRDVGLVNRGYSGRSDITGGIVSDFISDFNKGVSPYQEKTKAEPNQNIGLNQDLDSLSKLHESNVLNFRTTTNARQKESQIILPKINFAEAQAPQEAQKENQILRSIQKVLQFQKEEQVTKQTIRQVQTPRPSQTPKPKLPKPFDFGLPNLNANKKITKEEFGKMIEVFVGKGKKETKIGEFGNIQMAKEKLFGKLRGTLRASGYLKQGEAKIKLDLGGTEFVPSAKDIFRIVQPSKLRLKAKSEVGEIQYFKKVKGKKSKKLRFF